MSNFKCLLLIAQIFIMSFLICSCRHVCTTLVTRCNGSLVEICNSNGQWQRMMDCSTITSTTNTDWICCATTGGNTCLPKTDCGGE